MEVLAEQPWWCTEFHFSESSYPPIFHHFQSPDSGSLIINALNFYKRPCQTVQCTDIVSRPPAKSIFEFVFFFKCLCHSAGRDKKLFQCLQKSPWFWSMTKSYRFKILRVSFSFFLSCLVLGQYGVSTLKNRISTVSSWILQEPVKTLVLYQSGSQQKR